jgi:hypothetical protein
MPEEFTAVRDRVPHKPWQEYQAIGTPLAR